MGGARKKPSLEAGCFTTKPFVVTLGCTGHNLIKRRKLRDQIEISRFFSHTGICRVPRQGGCQSVDFCQNAAVMMRVLVIFFLAWLLWVVLNMLLLILRLLYLVISAGAILAYIRTDDVVGGESTLPRIIEQNKVAAFFVLLFLSQSVTIVDLLIRKKRIEVISAVYFGILVGVLLAYLMIQALTPIVPTTNPFNTVVVLITLLIMPYICVSLLLQTKDDFRFVIPYVEFQRDLKSGRPLVVDSSSLIDGRIADVIETQIIESQLIVPDFVLAEVQDIADSSDKNRRIRGRRGLEVLAKMQQSRFVDVRVQETLRTDFKMMTVDQKVVALAKQLRGGVITNDFNLNKVASVQGIPVINLNDVSNALKPRYIPGERLQIKVIKEGEINTQGVGYLDDGTMVVCENASHLLGKDISVIVTSVLQSSAGRMIFGKMVFRQGQDSSNDA